MNKENESKKEEFEGFRYGTSFNLDFHDYYVVNLQDHSILQDFSEELISTGTGIKTLLDLGVEFDSSDTSDITFLTDDKQIVETTINLIDWYDNKLEKYVGED